MPKAVGGLSGGGGGSCSIGVKGATGAIWKAGTAAPGTSVICRDSLDRQSEMQAETWRYLVERH